MSCPIVTIRMENTAYSCMCIDDEGILDNTVNVDLIVARTMEQTLTPKKHLKPKILRARLEWSAIFVGHGGNQNTRGHLHIAVCE